MKRAVLVGLLNEQTILINFMFFVVFFFLVEHLPLGSNVAKAIWSNYIPAHFMLFI